MVTAASCHLPVRRILPRVLAVAQKQNLPRRGASRTVGMRNPNRDVRVKLLQHKGRYVRIFGTGLELTEKRFTGTPLEAPESHVSGKSLFGQ